MLKSEEHSHQILVSQLNAEKRARRAAEKKVHDADLCIFLRGLNDRLQFFQYAPIEYRVNTLKMLNQSLNVNTFLLEHYQSVLKQGYALN